MWRRWIIFITLFVCTAVHARVLHVGDDTMQLYETKNTTPALNVKIGNEMWYGNLTQCRRTINPTSDKYLRIQQADTDYYASELATDYDIVDGKLLGVNCGFYLASTGTQYIDTEHIPTTTTRTEMDVRFSDDAYHPSGVDVCLFGVASAITDSAYEINFGGSAGQATTLLPWLCIMGTNCSVYSLGISLAQKTTRQTVVLDAKNKVFKYGTSTRSLSGQTRQNPHDATMVLFGYRRITNTFNGVVPYSANDFMYVYDVKIYEDDTLVRHFVPVPCGLKIGDYTVPQNGMWDIVEQKFYGNSGTGEFLYGSDE